MIGDFCLSSGFYRICVMDSDCFDGKVIYLFWCSVACEYIDNYHSTNNNVKYYV